MKQYPIWIDTHNPNYANQYSKSMGVKTSSSSDIKIGTSAKNSYDFLNHRIEVADNGAEKIFKFYVDEDLMKTATYKKNKKEMYVEDVESKLKERYFNKWKKEEEDAEQKIRNERYMERLRVNGGIWLILLFMGL